VSASRTRAIPADAEWAVIDPPIAAWNAHHPSVSASPWELSPHDLPPTGAVRYNLDATTHSGRP